MSRERSRARRGFTIAPLVILLVVALGALLAWRCWVKIHYGHGATGFSGGVIFGSVVLSAVCMALAGGVGSLCYFVFGKSESAANLGIGLTLLLPIGLFSWQGYQFLTHVPGARPTAPQSPLNMGSNSRAAQNLANHANQQAQTPPTPPPLPANPSAAPAGSPAAPPVPEAPPIAARPKSNAPADVAAWIGEQNSAAGAALGTLATDLATELEDLGTRFNALAGGIEKPERSIKKLEDSRLAITECKAKAEHTAARLRDLHDETERALATVPDSDRLHLSITFAHECDAMTRAMAADDMVRLLEAAAEEAEFLRENFSNWRAERGEIKFKDPALQGRHSGMRHRVEFAMRGKDAMLRRLAGG